MAFYLSEPDIKEIKPSAGNLPEAVWTALAKIAGADIVRMTTVYGGYSSAFSVLAETAGGTQFFIKGSHPEEMSHGAQNLRQEIFAYEQAAVLKKIAPRYIGSAAVGDDDGWNLGVWQAVDGACQRRWGAAHYQAFNETLEILRQDFDAGHIKLRAMQDDPYIDRIMTGKTGWNKIIENPDRAAHFSKMFACPETGKAWLARHGQDLTALSRQPVSPGRQLVHFDLRTDNILFDRTGACMIIDWPNAVIGNDLVDRIYLSCDLMLHGNGAAWEIFERLKISGPPDSRNDVAAVLAKLSGYNALYAYRPVPEKLPRLRWLNKGLLWAMVEWLAFLSVTSPLPGLKPSDDSE